MKIRCRICGDVIEGDKKGTFINCKCGRIAIDETEYYVKIIGDMADMSIIEDNRQELCEKMKKSLKDEDSKNG